MGDIPLMDKIQDQLYIGDVDDAKDYEYLEKKGIEVVLNLSSWHPKHEGFNEVTWINIPIKDGKGDQYSFDIAVQNAINQIKSDKTLMINCAAGVSRSGTVTATALAQIKGMKLREALKEVEEARPIINPNNEILQHGDKFLEKGSFSTASEEK